MLKIFLGYAGYIRGTFQCSFISFSYSLSRVMDPALLRLQLAQNLNILDQDILQNLNLLEQIQQQQQPRRRRRRRRARWFWVRPWLLRHPLYGQFEQLMPELEGEDPASFRNFVRMEPAMFRELINRLGPRISKQDTWY